MAYDLIDWVLAEVADTRTLIGRSEWLAYRTGVDTSRLWRWCACTAVLIAVANMLRERSLDSESQLLLALSAEEV